LLSQQVQQQAQQQSQPVVDTVKKEEEKKPQVIIQPTPKQIIQPAYPEAARKIGAEGTVFVEVTIGKDGKVVAARVIKSLNPACDNAAVEAAYKAVFNPGTIDGVPAEMKTTIPYRFKHKIMDYDLSSLEELFGKDSEDFKDILKAFISDYDQRYPLLEKAVKERDFEQISKLAHAFKSVVGNFNLQDLMEISKKIEFLEKIRF